jgi:hypothetical protein
MALRDLFNNNNTIHLLKHLEIKNYRSKHVNKDKDLKQTKHARDLVRLFMMPNRLKIVIIC